MEDLRIEVEGLAQLNRSLRRLDSEAPKSLRLALNDVAARFIRWVAPEIPRRSGRAAGSLTTRSTRTSARIAAGGRRAPYYPWLDFGGRVGRDRSVERPFYREGRYIYPTLRRRRGEIQGMIGDALVTVAQRSGLDVS